MAAPCSTRPVPAGVALLALVLALASCGGGGEGGGPGPGGDCLPGPGPAYGTFAEQPTAAEAGLAAQVLALVNVERAEAGLPPLTGDAATAKVAFDYAVDMDARDFFSHVNPECEDPGDRLTRAGIGWSAYAENIAAGQDTAPEVMAGWMASPGHRANVLSPDVTRLGVGVLEASGGTLWVQLFHAP